MTEELEVHPGYVRRWLPALKALAHGLFLFFAAPVRTLGRRNVPRSGTVLVVSNHMSNCDPLVVQLACPRHIHFLARKEIFSMGLLGKFMAWFRAVPIRQNSADKGAIKSAVSLLRRGGAVGIFPEGQLSPDGELLPLFEGTALIVRMAECPVICVGLRKTNKFMPSPRVVPTWAFQRITARWGQPRAFSKADDPEQIMLWIESELRSLTGQAPG